MASKYFGRATISVNGITLASLPGTAKLNPGGVERSPVVGDFGFLGYTEKPMHGEIECEIAVGGDTDLIALNRTTDATISFVADSGQRWTMGEATLASPVSIQSGDGKASLKFIGRAVEQS